MEVQESGWRAASWPEAFGVGDVPHLVLLLCDLGTDLPIQPEGMGLGLQWALLGLDN